MKILKIVAIVLLWIICGTINYGGSLADMEHDFPESNECRKDQGFSAVWGYMGGPLFLPVSAMITGAYAHGFQFSCKKVQP